MADTEFTVEQLGVAPGTVIEGQPEPLTAETAAHEAAQAVSHGAAEAGRETPLQQIGHGVPAAASSMQAALAAGVAAQAAQPAYSPTSSATSTSATASTYDDKPEHTSALAAPHTDETAVAEPEPAKAEPAPEAHPEPAAEAAHAEPEATHTEPAADTGGDHSA